MSECCPSLLLYRASHESRQLGSQTWWEALCQSQVIETGVCYASYILVSLSVGSLVPNVLDFKAVLLLVLVLELLIPSTGSFSTGTNLVSVFVEEKERKQELPGLLCRINESLF